MITIKSFSYSDTTLYQQALEIRKKVFIKEQNVAHDIEVEHEDQAVYYLILENEEPVGTGRWRKTDNGIKLERFAVLPQTRDKKYGSLLLQHVLEDLKKKKEKIYLHSQLLAISFYAREGFEPEGDIFVEANIKHQLMVKG